MSEDHSTTAASADQPASTARPEKPRLDFSLFPHAAGVRAKMVRGIAYSVGSTSGRRPSGKVASIQVNSSSDRARFPASAFS
jgi:hypothetical protein